jgi:hypothetical protein
MAMLPPPPPKQFAKRNHKEVWEEIKRLVLESERKEKAK